MLRRTVSSLLVFCIMMGIVTSTIVAVPSSSSIEETKWVTTSKIKSYKDSLDNVYRGQYGVLYNLYYITLLTRWTEFLYFEDFIGFSQYEKDEYRQSLFDSIKYFNNRFYSNPDNIGVQRYLPITLTDEGDFRTAVETLLETEIPVYVEGLLIKVIDDLSKASSVSQAEENKVLEDNRENLRYIYRILQVLDSEKREMERLVESIEGYDQNTLNFITDSTKASDILTREVYVNLLNRAKSLSEEESASLDNISYFKSENVVEQLAFVKAKEADKEWYSPEDYEITGGTSDFKLRESYVAMIASSAIYKPFESYVGDEEYLTVLSKLVGKESENIIKLYNEIKDYRKPLYTIEEAAWGDRTFGSGTSYDEASFKTYSGKGRLLTLDNFLDRIEREDVSGFVTHRGRFGKIKEDVDSWAFYEGKAITLAEEEVNSTQWTQSLFEFGYKDYYPITGLALMKNYIKNLKTLSSIENKKSRFLYINAFGDIVLDDNMVVVPAASNPMLYNSSVGYNPYTVAFMNGYPQPYTSGKTLRISNKDDYGKFLLMSVGPELNDKHIFIKIQGEKDLAVTHAKQPVPLFRETLPAGKEDMKLLVRTGATIPGWVDYLVSIFTLFDLKEMGAYQIASEMVYDVPIFPYKRELDEDGIIGEYIVKNMYWSYISNNGSSTANFNGRLREDFIFRNILVEGLNGTRYTTAYTKNVTENYQNLVDEGLNSFTRMVRDFNLSFLDKVGNIDGVIGIKNSYQDPIFGKLMWIGKEYMLYLIVIFLLVFIIKFMRQRIQLTYTIVLSVIAVGIMFLFLRVIPVYLPSAYNLFVNNVTKNLSYQILATKAEKYSDTYGRSSEVDSSGRFLGNTSSINLFRLSDKDLDTVKGRYQVDVDALEKGQAVILDTNTGLFIEGDTLKVNLDSLLYTNPVTGSYKETEVGRLYQFESKKMYSSPIEYYTPYYLIVDGFIETLNDLLVTYKIPRHTSSYGKGLDKDSFIVWSYVNSLPFLAPDDMSSTEEDITDEEMARLLANFEQPHDFLNLVKIFENPTPEMEESLWYQTLDRGGFIGDTPEAIAKRNDLVGYVNYHTKKFLIDMKPQVGLISDENMIKIVALHATTMFNQRASEYFDWMYPISLNYQEFKLKDIMLSSFVNDSTRFFAQDMDVVNYTADTSGLWGLILLTVLLAQNFTIALLSKFSIPILYLLFGILLTIKSVSGAKLESIVKGYMKASLIIFLSYTLFVWTMSSMNGMSEWYMFLATIINSVILFAMFMVLQSILFNITDMGNNSITAKLEWLMDKAKLGSLVENLKVSTTSLLNRNQADILIVDESLSRFSHDSDIQDSYTGSNYRERIRQARTPKKIESYIEEENKKLKDEVGYKYGNFDEFEDYKHKEVNL